MFRWPSLLTIAVIVGGWSVLAGNSSGQMPSPSPPLPYGAPTAESVVPLPPASVNPVPAGSRRRRAAAGLAAAVLAATGRAAAVQFRPCISANRGQWSRATAADGYRDPFREAG